MGFFDFLTSTESKDGDLIHHFENYVKRYELVCENSFIIGRETPPLKLKTTSTIEIKQEVVKKRLYTKITTLEIKGKTDSNKMEQGLNDALILAEISPVIIFERNLKGEILRIANKEQLAKDWGKWKNTRLPEIHSDEKVRNRFIRNYEKGLDKMTSNLKYNFTYQLIMPECLGYESFICKESPDKGDIKEVYSKLIPDMKLMYQMHLTKVIGRPEIADAIQLTSKIKYRKHLERDFLKKLYAQNPEFNSNEYNYSIKKEYQFNKQTSEIIRGGLIFEEKMHENLKYLLNLNLKQL